MKATRTKVLAGLLVMPIVAVIAALWRQPGVLSLAPPPPLARIDSDPKDPAKERKIVSREEREKLGLMPHTWQGVLHSDVPKKLDQLDKLAAKLKDRLRQGRDVKAYDLLERIKLENMVYVQVETKQGARRRVLASLLASEFHVKQVFDKLPGFVGYANRAALNKLAKNPEVIGVCLDHKPLPDSPMMFLQPEYDLPSAFKKADHVNVRVTLREDSIPEAKDLPAMLARNQKIMDLQDRVLSTVTADEAWVWGRIKWSTMMTLYVTQEGLAKVEKNPDVTRVFMDGPRLQFKTEKAGKLTDTPPETSPRLDPTSSLQRVWRWPAPRGSRSSRRSGSVRLRVKLGCT